MRASITAVVFRAVLALGLAAVGCGDDGGAGNKDQFIKQICDAFRPCCEAAGRPSDGAQCRAFYGAFTSSSSYDQSAADACLNEFRAASDKCTNSALDTPSCGKVFASNTGSAKPGDACDQDSDCAPADGGKVECVHAFINNASVQQCQVRMVGKAGSSPCVGTINGNITYSAAGDTLAPSGYTCDVAEGLGCDEDAGACAALPQIGETCATGFVQCVSGAFCSAGMCKAKSAAGGPCDFDSACAEGTYCPTDTKMCKATLADGAACTSSQECTSDDCTNGKCSANNDFTLTFLCGTN